MPGAEAPGFVSSLLRGAGAGNGLAGLDLDDFAFVSDALALVGLGLADAAHVAGELSDELLVRALHHDLRALDRHVETGGDGDRDRVGKADGEDEVLPAELGLVADALDFERLAVALAGADDHVLDQRPRQAVQSL